MDGLRPEYQDRINFVILDFDDDDDHALATEMGIALHPAYGVIPPDSGPGEIGERFFGPRNNKGLRTILDAALERYAGAEPAS